MPLLSFLNNPFCLAAATIITIGVLVYGIINQQKEEKVHTNGGGSGRRKPDSDSSGPDLSTFTFYENSESDVRRRRRKKSETKPCTRNSDTEREVDNKSSDDLKDAVRGSEFDEKNYYKNVFDKIENDVKNINQKDEKKKDFVKNIDDDSDSSENNDLVNLNETKLVNASISGDNAPDKNIQSGSNISMKDESNADRQETKQTDFDDPSSLGATGVNNQQNNTSSENVMCMACEEILADAVAYPCKHRYLCEDCAVILHRIYKKCTICDFVVEKFETVKR